MRQSIFIFAVLAVPFVIGLYPVPQTIQFRHWVTSPSPKFLVVCRIGSFLEYPSSCARNNYRDCTHPECKCPEAFFTLYL
ncbi:uncharacterized protein LOC111253173 isoform X2 [Varroa destructor]|uniref:Uncharacterized protein n=1 Tax=Varroa destructor TaxID=109461 RepID=A0A7M7KJV7_VARDE|nr:uncharacterized protein LOC111253173 isoform X2 [Varroa destructor]